MLHLHSSLLTVRAHAALVLVWWCAQVFEFDLDPDLEYKQVSERYLKAIKAWAEDAAAGRGATSDCAFYLFVDDDAYIHMQAWEALLNRPGVDAGAVWCEAAAVVLSFVFCP